MRASEFDTPGANMILHGSLFNTAKRVAVRNIECLEDVGGIPFDIVEPILQKVDRPAHLREIERRSPQIQGHTSELWLKFIKRDIPHWQKSLVPPENPEDWPFVYKDLKEAYVGSLQTAHMKVNQELAAREVQTAERSTAVVRTPLTRPQKQSYLKAQLRSQPWRLNFKPRDIKPLGLNNHYQPKRLQAGPSAKLEGNFQARKLESKPNPLLLLAPSRSPKPRTESVSTLKASRPNSQSAPVHGSAGGKSSHTSLSSSRPVRVESSSNAGTGSCEEAASADSKAEPRCSSSLADVSSASRLARASQTTSALPLLVRHRKVSIKRATTKLKAV